jgi:hypothetical protein
MTLTKNYCLLGCDVQSGMYVLNSHNAERNIHKHICIYFYKHG